jgi:hypothetical protein
VVKRVSVEMHRAAFPSPPAFAARSPGIAANAEQARACDGCGYDGWDVRMEWVDGIVWWDVTSCKLAFELRGEQAH